MLERGDRRKDDRSRIAQDQGSAGRGDGKRACRLGQAAEAAPVMIWVSDAQGAVEHVNRHFAAFVGYEPEPGGEGWDSSVHPDDYPVRRHKWRRTG
jgi:PAS domain S-box-containing protein